MGDSRERYSKKTRAWLWQVSLSCEQGGAEPGVRPPALPDYVTVFASDSIQQAAAEASRHRDGAGHKETHSLGAPCVINWACSLLPWGFGGHRVPLTMLCQLVLTSSVFMVLSLKYPKAPCAFAIVPTMFPQQMPLCLCWGSNADGDQTELQPSPWKSSLTFIGPY